MLFGVLPTLVCLPWPMVCSTKILAVDKDIALISQLLLDDGNRVPQENLKFYKFFECGYTKILQ